MMVALFNIFNVVNYGLYLVVIFRVMWYIGRHDPKKNTIYFRMKLGHCNTTYFRTKLGHCFYSLNSHSMTKKLRGLLNTTYFSPKHDGFGSVRPAALFLNMDPKMRQSFLPYLKKELYMSK
jgi:hypothetical protein